MLSDRHILSGRNSWLLAVLLRWFVEVCTTHSTNWGVWCSSGRLAAMHPCLTHNTATRLGPSPCVSLPYCSVITAHLVPLLEEHVNPQRPRSCQVAVQDCRPCFTGCPLPCCDTEVCSRIMTEIYTNVLKVLVLCPSCLPQKTEAKLEEILKEIKSLKDLVSSQEKRIIKLEDQMSKIAI